MKQLGKPDRAARTNYLTYAFVFAVLIVVLLVKPTGLLGKPVREKVLQ